MAQVLQPDGQGIATAAALLAAGELVAFPTETVYGLGADARNDTAVAKVFEAKGRPSFNPLIVHVADRAEIDAIAELPTEADALLAQGWPSGLTLVAKLRSDAGISPLVTAGLATVALRVPGSGIARDLLRAFGGPVAAPSANPSGRVSPTLAEHVTRGLGDRIAAVLDGGLTPAGLESTILIFPGPTLLREGAYPAPDTWPRQTQSETPPAPGQLLSHYAPNAAVRLNAVEKRPGEWHIGFGEVAGDVSLSRTGDLVEAAARLFVLLHEADANGITALAVAPIPDIGLGRAINDRLRRAAAPRG
ncbi:MAG: L-threonylcarbamoyladenylate synthase [Pseudomonadota bacterium]